MYGEPSRYGILHFYCVERSKFEQNLFIARKTYEPEAIHQYRVSLKRIRALFHMLEFITNGAFRADVLFMPLRTVFKPGGKLRDIHVQLELLDEYENETGTDFTKLREFLFFLEIKYQRRFLKRTKRSIEKPMDRLMWKLKKIADKHTEVEFNTRAKDWITSEMAYLKEIHEFIYDPLVFHRFRRHQKETFYMIDFINNYTSGSIALEGSLQELKKIAKKIGEWHDQYNILNHTKYIKHLFNDNRLRISKECDELFNHVDQKHRDLFNELRTELDDEGLFLLKGVMDNDP